MTGDVPLPADTTEAKLRTMIRAQGSVVVALSGGVDSTLVAAIAAAELRDRALAVTGISASLPAADLDGLRALCSEIGIAHETVETRELDIPAYRQNNPDRCYHCKAELFGRLQQIAVERGFCRVLDGTTKEDLAGHRPGHRAATELDVLSPLVEVEAGDADVRRLANRLGLPNKNKPSSPCLSSRIAYGLEVTQERLSRVERAEALLKELGLSNLRVRLHGKTARIEVEVGQMQKVIAEATRINQELRALGFVYVTLDLGGRRTGSLLEVLDNDPQAPL